MKTIYALIIFSLSAYCANSQTRFVVKQNGKEIFSDGGVFEITYVGGVTITLEGWQQSPELNPVDSAQITYIATERGAPRNQEQQLDKSNHRRKYAVKPISKDKDIILKIEVPGNNFTLDEKFKVVIYFNKNSPNTYKSLPGFQNKYVFLYKSEPQKTK